MKIIAQSTLTVSQPYAHLGYIAAAYEARGMFKANSQLLGGGFLALSLGVAMAFSVIMNKTARGWTAFNFVRRRSLVLLVGGLALMAAGAATITAALMYKTFVPPSAAEVTVDRAWRIINAVPRDRAGEDLTLADLDLPDDTPTSDGWNRPMRLIKTAEPCAEDIQRYLAVSAGPDGQFDTDDDISMSILGRGR